MIIIGQTGFTKSYFLKVSRDGLLCTLGKDGGGCFESGFRFGRSRFERGSLGFLATKLQRSWTFRRGNFNPHWNYVRRVDVTYLDRPMTQPRKRYKSWLKRSISTNGQHRHKWAEAAPALSSRVGTRASLQHEGQLHFKRLEDVNVNCNMDASVSSVRFHTSSQVDHISYEPRTCFWLVNSLYSQRALTIMQGFLLRMQRTRTP